MKNKASALRILKIVSALLILLILSAAWLFRQELEIISTLKARGDDIRFYEMSFNHGYHLDEIINSDISSDAELASVLSSYMSHGFYSPARPDIKARAGCSALAARTPDGDLIWGRNFDWYRSVPIIVRATPENGYASISTCNFEAVTGDENMLPEGIAGSFLAVASYYVPMDGINEKGLCVALLEVNEGGQELIDTEKPNITVTMAIRLLLDRASDIDEALMLLRQYDICPVGGVSSHLFLADRSGRSAAVEFMGGSIYAVSSPAATNFNLKNKDIDAGGESARRRYLELTQIYDRRSGIMTWDDLVDAMGRVSQRDGSWLTRWSCIYKDSKVGPASVSYYWNADFKKPYTAEFD